MDRTLWVIVLPRTRIRSFNTYITRLDYHITASGSETLFARGEMQNFKEPGWQQFPGQTAATTVLDDSKGITDRTHFTDQSQADQRFSLGLHSSGRADRRYFWRIRRILLNGIDSLVPFTRSTTALCQSISSPKA